MIDYQDHIEIAPFFQVAGLNSKEERIGYLPTQIRCFIEEAEEIGATLDKTFESTGELLENIADDVGDTLFSGAGVIYMLCGEYPEDDPYEYIDELFDLTMKSDPEVDSCYFIIKNEIKTSSISWRQTNARRNLLGQRKLSCLLYSASS